LTAQSNRSVGFFSADAGLFFDRDFNLGGRDLVQTLEPRVFYLRQVFAAQQALPVFDSMPLGMSFDQLFSDDRFAGLDRVVTPIGLLWLQPVEC
jgi:LPS-assembly protein